MFQKILIANRGEIALRIARTCREMNIPSVALYQASDQGSLHVRLADECVLLDAPGGFMNGEAILEIAEQAGADAIHPGYGFLAEQAEFVRACDRRGIVFIGPPAHVIELTANKVEALNRVKAAGVHVPPFSVQCYDREDDTALNRQAELLGYPLVVKSCRGGRGRGAHLVREPERLNAVVRRAQQEAQVVYGDRSVYLERLIAPARQLSVQILADENGNLVHLGEREGSLLVGNQKVIEEAPAPSLDQAQRERLWQSAAKIARLFEYTNVGTVEFLLDATGETLFTEIKARIQTEHPLTEMLTRVDLVRQQILLAAGETLEFHQDDVRLDGWAMLARISAQDPWNRMMPSPGLLRRVRLPGGSQVRTDTFVYSGCNVPSEYDPLIAKLVVQDADRESCRKKLERALAEFKITGATTTLALLQTMMRDPDFVRGDYDAGMLPHKLEQEPIAPRTMRDLALAAAVYYHRTNRAFQPVTQERILSGWHRSSRNLPD